MRSLIKSKVDTSSTVSADLLVTFWTLSLYDISVPADRYAAEIKMKKKQYADLDNSPIPSNAPDAAKKNKARK
jgi:hypothetical protein